MDKTNPSVSEIKAVYDRAYRHPGIMGTHFDTEYSQVTKETLLARIEEAPNRCLLDLGTGDGDLWEFVSPDVERHGLDISATGVRRAVDRFPDVDGVVGIGEHLPYEDDTFGMVVAADTLEHTIDLESSVKEIHRVLVPGGLLAFSVPAPDSLRKWGWNRLVLDRAGPRMILSLAAVVIRRAMLFGRPDFQPIDRDLDMATWRRIVTAAGFEIFESAAWPTAPYEPIVYLLTARAVSEAEATNSE